MTRGYLYKNPVCSVPNNKENHTWSILPHRMFFNSALTLRGLKQEKIQYLKNTLCGKFSNVCKRRQSNTTCNVWEQVR